MEGHLSTSELWSRAPDMTVRKQKRVTEEELLQKLCIKKELMEFHPAILTSQPIKRLGFYISLNYSRVRPPSKEILPNSRNPTLINDPAVRQLSNLSRLGPRDSFLPNPVKPNVRIRVKETPATDTEYHALRAAATERLTKLFSEWSGFNRLAFPKSNRKKSLYQYAHLGKELSKSSLHMTTQGHHRLQSGSCMPSSGPDTRRGRHQIPDRGQTIQRWRNAMKEIRQHLLASRMQLPQVLSKSELIIYVSSTPDLQEEREFLEEVTYPKLLELCEGHGLGCHVIDLRSESGMLTNDLETFHLIEKELQRCRKESIGPYFICLVGQALDDQELPGFLPQTVYELIRKTLIQEKIIGVEAFDEVYRLDSNQAPHVYIKQPIRTLEEYKSVEEVVSVLYNALIQAVKAIARNKDASQASDVDFYTWSAVVKEIQCGLLTAYTPRRDTLCFMMDMEQDQDSLEDEETTPIQRLRLQVCRHYQQNSSRNRLIGLKREAKSIAYLRSISDAVESRVASLLGTQIRSQEYDIAQQLTEGTEVLQHVRLAASQPKDVIGSEDTISAIKDIIERADPAPKTVLLWGQSGSGKTAIVSRLCRDSIQWQPRRKVVIRCLGTTLRSSSLIRVLESLVKQLTFLYSLNTKLPTDMNLQQAVSLLCQTLEMISAQRHLYGDLLLVLDQLERLSDLDAHYLLRILSSVTTGITLILTLQTPHPLFNIVRSNKTVHTISTAYMDKKDFGVCLKNSLKAIKRLVTNDQLQSVLNALPTDITPLHVQLMFSLTRWWKSHNLPDVKPLSDNPDEDFLTFLELTEKQLGRAFTRHALSVLAAAKHGLADHEILHLLSKDSDLLNEIKEENKDVVSVVDGFPYQYQFSRLISRLGPFISRVKLEGETVYQIKVQPLTLAISSRYLSDSFFHTVHFRLANFFLFIRRGLLLSSKEMSEQSHKQLSKYHWRMLRCIPYHLCHSSDDTACVWTRLKEKVFFNFAWLINEVYYDCFNELLEDINYCLENVSLDPDIQYLQQLLISIRETVTHNPLSLAAVFSSLRVKGSHRASNYEASIVKEAQVWLKQIQVQALVPVPYTSNKTGRLLVEDNCMFGVADIIFINNTDKLLVQRMRKLSVYHMLTHEEYLLDTLKEDIVSLNLLDGVNVVALTKDSSCQFAAEVYSLDTDMHICTVLLTNSAMVWYDVRSLKMLYFAVNSSIKRADLERGSVMNLLTTRNEWASSCISSGKPDTIFTVTVANKTRIEATSIHDFTETKSVTLNNDLPNTYCKRLFSTKNGRHVIFVTETQVIVIDCSSFKVISTYGYNSLPIIYAELSRSHEHVFVAYANGNIICYVLHSGIQSMFAKVDLKERLSPKTPEETDGSAKTNPPLDKQYTEVFTTYVTSEDDHFLFCGTNTGRVCVVHVPTGRQLVDITTRHESVHKMVYVTSKNHFQHIITIGVDGTALHWDLRPLLKQARVLLQGYITDDDLYKEEETKLDLSKYFSLYETKRNNRIFLNGPDIKSFYQLPSPEVFSDLANFDPAFRVQDDWERTGTISDLTGSLAALTCGNELSGVVLTMSTDFRLAKWNLQTGNLVWIKTLHCPRKAIHNIASVFYDQAVLLSQAASANDGFDISVFYTGEGQSKTMTRDNVSNFWVSLDRTRVVLMCRDSEQLQGRMMYLWDMMNARELVCEYQQSPSLGSGERIHKLTSFSPSLQSCVCLVVPAEERTKQRSSDALSKSPDFSLCSAVESDSQHLQVTPGSNSDMTNCSIQISNDVTEITPNDEMVNNGVETLTTGTGLQNASDTNISVHETSLPSIERERSGDGLSNFNITETTKVPSDTPCSGNGVTYVYSTQIHIRSQSSGSQEQQKEVTNDGTRLKLPDINHSRPGSSPPSFASKHTTDNIQGKPRRGLMEHEGNMGRTGTSSGVSHAEFCVPVQVTSLCFVGEQEILAGTHAGHVLLLEVPSCNGVLAFGECGPTYGEEITQVFLKDAPRPHKCAVSYVTMSQDSNTFISSDSIAVCLWSAGDRSLIMKIEPCNDQKISHMVISKEAAIIAMATNSRTIYLWTPVERREIASYRTTFDITNLQMTCDCHKVVVRGLGPERNEILEIFDILNVDNILTHVAGRRQLQQIERREHLASERKTNRQQREKSSNKGKQ